MRLFVSIPVTPPACDSLAQTIEKAIQTGADAGFADPNQLHCTLAFLGEKSEGQAKELIAALSSISFPRFSATALGLGVFPNEKSPQVFWAGIESKELLELQKQVSSFLNYREDRPFHPHVTLARIRSQHNSDKLVALSKSPADFGPFQVNSFYLMKSELSSKGAVHSIVAEFALL
jgi:2'-5' RNA ligase